MFVQLHYSNGGRSNGRAFNLNTELIERFGDNTRRPGGVIKLINGEVYTVEETEEVLAELICETFEV